jgi:DNA-directed RNA polymerase specialized sigma24 family protein
MLKLVRTQASTSSEHEDQFLRRDQWLRSWAMKLCQGDADSADDLLQNAFIQFCLRRVDLESISDIDAYLYTMLRNLRLSQLMLATRTERRTIPIEEYDTVDRGLLATDPTGRLQACVDVSSVCEWACHRKEESKSASVLILRFFHGLLSSEIAPIIGSSSRIVGAWLQVARRELRAHRQGADGESGRFEAGTAQQHSAFIDCATTIDQLRARIFTSHKGPCLSDRDLKRLYVEHSGTISCSRLAHVVSCQECLRGALVRIDLPNGPEGPIGSSDSMTLVGKSASESTATSMSSQLLRRWRGGLQDVLEHSPSKLLLGTNGFIVGRLKVHSEMSEISVEVAVTEPPTFIEVFGSQGVEMLLFELSPPPNGGARQSTHVEYAEGRSLTVTVDFTRPKPVIELQYHDPLFVAAPDPLLEEPQAVLPEPALRQFPNSWLQSLWNVSQRHFAWSAMRVKGPAIGLGMIVLIAALWWYRQLTPTPAFAAGLLRQAAQGEQIDLGATDSSTHCVLRFEESSEGRAVRRSRIDIRYSGLKRIKAVRVYDESNHLEAGEWTSANGERTIYRPGKKAVKESSATQSAITSANTWRFEPTAQEFTRLVSGLVAQDVSEESGRWIITYQRPSSSPNNPLVEATLVLDKRYLEAKEQTLVLQEAGITREFHFTESRRERLSNADEDQSYFTPEPELAGGPIIAPRLGAPIARALTGVDRDRFEMALTYQLHQLEPCLAGHPAVNIGDDGRLIVDARTNTPRCSKDVTRGLSAFAGPSLVSVEVATVTPTDNHVLTLDELEHIRGYDLFTAYFASRVLNRDAEREAIRQKVAWASEHSRDVVYHAEALAQLTQRWQLDSLRQLDLNSVRKWQEMVRAHAIELVREEQLLRTELQPILFPDMPSPPSPAAQELNGLSDISPVVDELVALAMLQDETIRSLCTPPSQGGLDRPLDPVALGSSFDRAVAVASALTQKWPLDP